MGQELPANFVVRGRMIYLRIEVPEDVQATFGRKHVLQSLGTGNRKIALPKGYRRLSELHAEWDDIRRRAAPTPAHRHQAAHGFYQAVLARDEQRRVKRPTAEDLDTARAKAMQVPPDLQSYVETASKNEAELAILDHILDFLVLRDGEKMDREARATFMTELRAHLGSGETALVASFADDIVRREGLYAPRGSVAYRELCRDLLRSWIAALETMKARDEGNYAFTPSDPIVSPRPGGPAPLMAKPGETIMEMFEVFASQNPRGVKQDTLNYSRVSVALFVESLPAGFPASAIDKARVVEWADLLRSYPVKAAETSAFKGMRIREVVAANAKLSPPKPVISTKTFNKHLSALSPFCQWLSSRNMIPNNPVEGLFAFVDKEPKVRPYTIPELNTLFRTPLFAGYKQSGKEHLPGSERDNEWRYWLPLLALFTGARLSELAQLLVRDIREQSGQWLFHFTTDGEETKSLKNKYAKRIVPVHPELVRLGFLRFHAEARGQGRDRLFPDLLRNSRGQIAYPSDWFRRYFKRVGIKTGREVNFHSIRHVVFDEFRIAGYLDSEFGFMVGHTNSQTAVTRGYGKLQEGNLARRVEMIEKIKFPGLDLSHLHQCTV